MAYQQGTVKKVNSTRLTTTRASDPENYDPRAIDAELANNDKVARIANVVGCTHEYFDPLLETSVLHPNPGYLNEDGTKPARPDDYTLYIVNSNQEITDYSNKPYYSDFYFGSRKISDIQIVTTKQAGDDISDYDQDGTAPDGKLYIVINPLISESHPNPTISKVVYKYAYTNAQSEKVSRYLPIVSNIFKDIRYESESGTLFLTLDDDTEVAVPCLNEDGIFDQTVMDTLEGYFHPKWYEFSV